MPKKHKTTKRKKQKKEELPLFSFEKDAVKRPEEIPAPKEEKPLRVGEFLDQVNDQLGTREYRVQGEVGRAQARGNYSFFDLKDAKEQSLVNCFAWANVLSTCGIQPEEGMEVIVTGYPEIFKRTGNFNFQVKAIELVGEGALKKAFEELKAKLETEGLFSEEIKRPIPLFSRRIALVTSRHGQAINDFLMNVGQFGLEITLRDCRVEGQRAVFELLAALRFFNQRARDFDALVLIRGGGSWESLQAFNNEKVARAIRDSEIPVIVGVGHEGDVTIADWVSDFRSSTPTGAAKKIGEPWLRAREQALNWENIIWNRFAYFLQASQQEVDGARGLISRGFDRVFLSFRELEDGVRRGGEAIGRGIEQQRAAVTDWGEAIGRQQERNLKNAAELLGVFESQIRAGDPKRQLKLGYNIATKAGKVVKSARELTVGDELELRFGDGQVLGEVKERRAGLEEERG